VVLARHDQQPGSISWNASQPGSTPWRPASAVIEAAGDTVVIALAKQIDATNTDRVLSLGRLWRPGIDGERDKFSRGYEGLFGEIGAALAGMGSSSSTQRPRWPGFRQPLLESPLESA
jgi:hypothetical protein